MKELTDLEIKNLKYNGLSVGAYKRGEIVDCGCGIFGRLFQGLQVKPVLY